MIIFIYFKSQYHKYFILEIRKILVPIDGSTSSFRGLDEAIKIARNCKATITGLFVVPFFESSKTSKISTIEKMVLDDNQKSMEKAKIRSAKRGILFEADIIHGEEGQAIVNFARKKKFDLVVIGSKGRGSMMQFFLGSTSNYVIHKASIPVLVVK